MKARCAGDLGVDVQGTRGVGERSGQRHGKRATTTLTIDGKENKNRKNKDGVVLLIYYLFRLCSYLFRVVCWLCFHEVHEKVTTCVPVCDILMSACMWVCVHACISVYMHKWRMQMSASVPWMKFMKCMVMCGVIFPSAEGFYATSTVLTAWTHYFTYLVYEVLVCVCMSENRSDIFYILSVWGFCQR